MKGQCAHCGNLFQQGAPFYDLHSFDAVYLGPTKNEPKLAALCSLDCLKAHVEALCERTV